MHCRRSLVLAWLLVASTPGHAESVAPRVLADSALPVRRAGGSADDRVAALQRLEAAALRAPGDRRAWHELAEGRLALGFVGLAREAWEHVLAVDSTDARAWEGVADTWKHDWVRTLAPVSRASATNAYYRAASNDGRRTRAWCQLGILLYEDGDGDAAAVAASRALECAPADPHAMLVGALMAYRSGRPAIADSLFRIAVPSLPPELAAHFEDVRPLLAPAQVERYDELPEQERPEFRRRFWSESDPDPTASWNVARLEYQARAAHALLLLEDGRRSYWDARAELLVRYGSPRAAAYQPPGVPLAVTPHRGTGFVPTSVGWRRIGEAIENSYPRHVQVISYPQFGLGVTLVDDGLRGEYEFRRTRHADFDPDPDTALVRALGLDLTGGGRGVFPRLPPLTTPRELAVSVARFEGSAGPRLLAYVRAPGEPSDDLVATLVVVDSSEHEVRHTSARLTPSSCDAAAFRSGEFAFDLPPGPYRVAFSVSDRKGGHGVERRVTSLAPATATLMLSDLVPVCSTPDVTLEPGTIRLDPALPVAIRSTESLQAYFEVYRLRHGADGRSSFDYEYEVHAVGADRRPWYRKLAALGQRPALVSVRSNQSGSGPVRRQFIHVPGTELAAGRYRLTLRVRDRMNGAVAQREIEFEKVR